MIPSSPGLQFPQFNRLCRHGCCVEEVYVPLDEPYPHGPLIAVAAMVWRRRFIEWVGEASLILGPELGKGLRRSLKRYVAGDSSALANTERYAIKYRVVRP